MAALSKNGKEIGRWYRDYTTFALFENRWILKNYGNGWKRYKRVAEGVDLQTFYNNLILRKQELERKSPHVTAFWNELRKEPKPIQYRLFTSIRDNGGDLDAVFSDLDDSCATRGKYAHSDLAELCQLYRILRKTNDEIVASGGCAQLAND